MINPKTAAKQWLRKKKAKHHKNHENKVNVIGSVGVQENARNQFFNGKNPFYHAGKNSDKRIEREKIQKENYEKNLVKIQTILT